MEKNKTCRKRVKTIVSMVLTVAIAVAFCFTASAVVTSVWSDFPTQELYDYSSYTYGVQSELYRYSAGCRNTMGSIDGDFGEATAAAVEIFQANEGLTVDGSVGPVTWDALYSRLSKHSTSSYYTYYQVDTGYSSSYAIAYQHEPVLGVVVTGWYGFYADGTMVYFGN